MRGYAMLRIGESGWIDKERPECGPLDAIVKPLAIAICTSDIHTLWEGAIGDRHNMIFEKYFHGQVDTSVVLFKRKNDEKLEITVRSGKQVFRAESAREAFC